MYVLAFCRVVIGFAFLISSVSKARDIAQFQRAIRNFNILPDRLSGIAASLFLCTEFVAAALVFIGGPLLFIGFFLALGLLLLFSLALQSVLARRIRTSCACFGAGGQPVSSVDVWRNLGFILCALGGIGALIWTKGSQENLNLFEWLLTGLGAVAFVALWVQLGEIARLFRQV